MGQIVVCLGGSVITSKHEIRTSGVMLDTLAIRQFYTTWHAYNAAESPVSTQRYAHAFVAEDENRCCRF